MVEPGENYQLTPNFLKLSDWPEACIAVLN